MRVTILGGGYIGRTFASFIQGARLLRRKELDYTLPENIGELMADSRSEVVINCAGFTGRPNIDECEVRRAETVRANLVLPGMLSEAARRYRRTFVHISSGCIYEGDNNGQGWSEDDPPAPRSFYSVTKALAEHSIEGYVIRIRMPLGTRPDPRNLLTKLLSYPRLISVPNSITALEDMVLATLALLESAPAGIYNVTNSGTATHRDLVEAFQAEGHSWHPEFIPLEELDTAAPRSNCVLDNSKVLRYYDMPDVHSRIREAAAAYYS